MFFRRRIQRLETALTEIVKGQTALAGALEKLATYGPPAAPAVDAAGSAIKALSEMMKGMSAALAASQEGNAKLLDGLLNRAARQVTRHIAQDMAAESHKSRRRNKELARGLPPWVAQCEECLAFLQKRSPTHTNDLSRHALEGHMAQLTVFVNQIELPLANGSGN